MARISYTLCKKTNDKKVQYICSKVSVVFLINSLSVRNNHIVYHVNDRQNRGVSETKGTWSCG